ncbi:MAG: polymer-forming cytoskeletal protein [Gemmatimonadetes bacterium]|nr:polymer-forming cytoskeletal protein [Gemmatimonadota bacterium]
MARNRKPDPNPPLNQANTSLIAAGARVEGDIAAEGTVRVEGMVKGNITAGKAVVIGAGGTFEGELTTQDASIFGQVNGIVTAKSRLELKSEAQVVGTVYAKRMQLDLGAAFEGTLVTGKAAESVSERSGRPATVRPGADRAVKEKGGSADEDRNTGS